MRMKSFQLASFTLALTTAIGVQAPLHAQTAAPAKIDLQAAYQAAQSYDAGFVAARASLEASKEKVVQARSANLPTLNLSSAGNVNRQDIYRTNIADRTYYSGSMILSSSYPVWRPATGDAISQAELAARVAQASFANAQQDLITRVSQAYFDVLLAQDTLTSIAAQKAAISEQLAQAKREFEVGTKTILDTNEAQARFDLMIAQEAAAKGDELTKSAALSLLTGQSVRELAALKPSATIQAATPSDMAVWADRAEQASIAVQIAQLNEQIAKLEISRNQKLNGPSLDIVSSLTASRSVGSSTTAARSTVGSGTIGVQFNYPIYNGDNLNSKVREAALNHEKAVADLNSAKRNAAQIARQSYLGLTYGISQISALESAQRSNLTLLDSTKLGYQVGVRINLDVLNAQQALANNKKDLAKARYDAFMSGIRLKAATAQLSELDLQSVNQQLQ